jgi:hypothetical protein
MIKDIQGLRKFTDCSMPSNEKERIHKAEIVAYNQAINDAIEIVKNCSIPDVVGQSERLKAVQKLKDFAYEVCPLHREDDLEEIVGSL